MYALCNKMLKHEKIWKSYYFHPNSVDITCETTRKRLVTMGILFVTNSTCRIETEQHEGELKEGLPVAVASKLISKAIQAALTERCDREEKLRGIAREIVEELSGADPSGDERMLDLFVSELVLSAADQRRKRERRQHQMECITAAKAKGVRFGPEPKPLPENFDECYEIWRDGRITAVEAAEKCGLSRGAFYRAIKRKEQTASCAV